MLVKLLFRIFPLEKCVVVIKMKVLPLWRQVIIRAGRKEDVSQS